MNASLHFALGLGFFLGLKHATEADHLVAVTTIVSEQRSILRSMLVGALWGVGHTVSLLAAGVVVLLLEVTIPQSVAHVLEFAVALMIIFLGTRILYQLLRGRRHVHIHAHSHDGYAHTHLHFHDQKDAHELEDTHDRPHHRAPFTGWKPVIIGMVHGLAGSATLTLLVLTEVVRGGSRVLGLAYLAVFGVGSVGGMLVMSTLISFPFVVTTRRFERFEVPMRLVVAVSSIAFGFYYAWIIGGEL